MSNEKQELQAIQVYNTLETARGECWKHNVATEFPVKSISSKNGELEVLVGAPHDGYTIQSTLLNYKLNGESHIISEEKVIVADLYFDNGLASGPCTLFDKSGLLFFRGNLENGYRQGMGTEYDENERVIFEGFFENGLKKPIIRMEEKKGYWKEYDEKGNLVSISQRDEYGRMEGICYFYDNEKKISRISEWKEGKEIATNGYCEIFDDIQRIWYKGYFENGCRQGRGAEYDENGKMIFAGFFEKGKKKTNICKMKKKKGYWEEYDEEKHLVNRSQRDEYGRMKGICYLYNGAGEISRVSEWKEGKEICLHKQFTNDYMTELKSGLNRYIGGYKKSFKSDYAYEGEGKLYDNDGKSAIYKGHFCNGKRHGLGISYRRGKISYNGKWIIGMPSCVFIIIYILLVLILASAFVLNMFYAMILLGILLFFIVLKRIFAKQTGNWLNSIDFTCLGEIIYTTQKNKGKKEGGCLSLAHHLYAIVLTLVVILFCFAAVYHFFFMPCDGYILQWSYYAKWNRCNGVRSFNPNMKSKLRSIRIGDKCFRSLQTFRIEGYNRLKTINIGKNSFTQNENSYGNDESKSFHILNCDSLESIEIGEFSFSDFAGEFELKNLSRLQSIQIGTTGSWSGNFYRSSFVIRGSDIILNIEMIRSSKSTIHYFRLRCISLFLIHNN